jgi:hypothetical protein
VLFYQKANFIWKTFRLEEVSPQHSGEWLCELEKYHPGFSRR